MKTALPAWVREAACVPVAFAQVREDPRIDLELCASLDSGATVVMVASGGDTALCLARLDLGRLILVDVNPAQLALVRCKWHLAQRCTRQQALEWLGHAPLTRAQRCQRVRTTLHSLDLPPDALGPLALVAEHGADFAGRYELVFAALRRALRPVQAELDSLLHSEAGVLDLHPRLAGALDAAFEEVMELGHLVAIFGPQATHNPVRSFASHFAERTRVAAARFPPRTNPFLWQVLAGAFPPGLGWDWLAPQSWSAPELEPEYVPGQMLEVLAQMPPESVDLVHLSNILDWLSADQATRLLLAARKVLRVGAPVIVRQLNSSLDIPRLPSGLDWDGSTGAALQARDRSFFYPYLHLGRKL